MKYLLLTVILFSTYLSVGQHLSSDPYELYWHDYVLEFNRDNIIDNKIQKVYVKDMEYKKGKVKKDIIHYSLELDSQGRPTKYITQTQAEIKASRRYNPIWRAGHDYPVFDILEYDLEYDDDGKLTSVMQTDKRTNRDYNPQMRLVFKYDSVGNVVSQSTQDIHHVIGTTRYSVMADITYKYEYAGDSVIGIIKYSSAGADLDNPSADTMEVLSGSRFQTKEYNFGDDKESFVRNVPIDKSESLYGALDRESKIVRSKNGLRESKTPLHVDQEEHGDEYLRILKYLYEKN